MNGPEVLQDVLLLLADHAGCLRTGRRLQVLVRSGDGAMLGQDLSLRRLARCDFLAGVGSGLHKFTDHECLCALLLNQIRAPIKLLKIGLRGHRGALPEDFAVLRFVYGLTVLEQGYLID